MFEVSQSRFVIFELFVFTEFSRTALVSFMLLSVFPGLAGMRVSINSFESYVT